MVWLVASCDHRHVSLTTTDAASPEAGLEVALDAPALTSDTADGLGETTVDNSELAADAPPDIWQERDAAVDVHVSADSPFPGERDTVPGMVSDALDNDVASAGDSQTYQGILTTSSEHRWFVECGSTARWWWNWERLQYGGIAGYEKLVPATRPAPLCGDASVCDVHIVYVRVEGRVSPEGVYGHLGEYKREIDILRIEEAWPTPPPGCAVPTP
jgi:hypothetical protein